MDALLAGLSHHTPLFLFSPLRLGEQGEGVGLVMAVILCFFYVVALFQNAGVWEISGWPIPKKKNFLASGPGPEKPVIIIIDFWLFF